MIKNWGLANRLTAQRAGVSRGHTSERGVKKGATLFSLIGIEANPLIKQITERIAFNSKMS